MVKPSKRDLSNKHIVHLGDGHTTVNSTPRTLRSNAAISQIFIASTAASTSTTSLSSPITMSTLPYSTVQPPMTNHLPKPFGLNSLHRKIDTVWEQNITGTSLLCQDFFLKGVEQDNSQPIKEQAGDDLSNSQNQTTPKGNSSRGSNQNSSNSADHVSPSLSSANVTNSSENDIAQKDVNSNRIDLNLKPVVDNYQAKKPSPKTNSDAVITKDFMSDLKSLIFDETSISNHNESYQINDIPNCSNNSFRLADNNNTSLSITTTTSSPVDSRILQSPVITQNNASAMSNLSNASSSILPCSELRQIDFMSQPVPGPSNTSCATVELPKTAQDTCPVSQSGPSISENVNISAPKSPEKRNNSRSARRARRSAAQDKRFATISKLPAIPSALGDPQQQLQDINVVLPPNWEARLDAHGRVFYIDHERRTTTWHRPQNNQINAITSMEVGQPRKTEMETHGCPNSSDAPNSNYSVSRVNDPTEQQRDALNRRYTLRRTISSRRPIKTLGESIVDASSSSLETQLIDPVALKATQNKQSAIILNHDAIDGNCISGPATNRAMSYNLCVDRRFQPATTSEPRPSTSQQCAFEPPTNVIQHSANLANGHHELAHPNQESPVSSQDQPSPTVSCPPALKFLNRSDFCNLLHLNDEALMLYTTSTNLKYIINKVRKDKTNSAYERFQHNKDLVAFLNKFSNRNEPLPSGWEMKMDGMGKRFFIDHVRKATTYVDPRLPTEVPLVFPHQVPFHDHRTPASVAAANAAAAIAVASSSSASTHEASRLDSDIPSSSSRSLGTPENAARTSPVSGVGSTISQDPAGVANLTSDSLQTGTSQPTIVRYEEKIVAFFKQSNIFDIIKERRSASNLLNCSLRDKINQIRKGGLNVLKKYSHDVNLMMIISLFDLEIDSISTPTVTSRPVPQIRTSVGRIIIPAKRDFEEKLRYFYKKLEQKSFGQGPNKLKLGIRRNHILEDAFTKVMSVNSKKDLQRSRLYVSFAGEEGLDYGGPSREFFFLLSRELFNPYYGKFD